MTFWRLFGLYRPGLTGRRGFCFVEETSSTAPKPQRRLRKVRQPNRRSRAERPSDSDNDFTSFVYQANTTIPVLSQITISYISNPAGAFWSDLMSTNYSPPQGTAPDPWLTGTKMSTLTSTQLSTLNLSDLGAGTSNDDNYTMSSPTTKTIPPTTTSRSGGADQINNSAPKNGGTTTRFPTSGVTVTPKH